MKNLRPTGVPRNDYEVGYKRPPVNTRFKKGHKGFKRRAKQPTVGSLIETVLSIRAKSGEGGRTMTALEAILRRLVHTAAKGDIRAITLLFTLRDRYRDSTETTLSLSDLHGDDRKIIEEYYAALHFNEGGKRPQVEERKETGDKS